MQEVLGLCHYTPVKLKVPFIRFSKGDIVKMGLGYKVPFELTYTCYEGTSLPCKLCVACVERAEAFKLNKATDTLLGGTP